MNTLCLTTEDLLDRLRALGPEAAAIADEMDRRLRHIATSVWANVPASTDHPMGLSLDAEIEVVTGEIEDVLECAEERADLLKEAHTNAKAFIESCPEDMTEGLEEYAEARLSKRRMGQLYNVLAALDIAKADAEWLVEAYVE